jgi:hypothetical protein
MTAKRLLIPSALALLAGVAGCRSWCENHYPCGQQPAPVVASAAPVAPGACCCPAGTAPVAPVAVPAAPAAPVNWGASPPCPSGCVPAGR